MGTKIILITGATSNLGRIVANTLVDKGHIVYGGHRKGSVSEGVTPIKLDITSDSDCKKAVSKIIKERGRIDVLINNAGNTVVGKIQELSVEDYLKVLNINAIGTLRLIKLVLPEMKKKKSGRIINITSLNGLVSMPRFGMYSASKHALSALGEALRYEVANDGIWVTNIAPGAIYSEENGKKISHKTAREKFILLKLLLPMVKGEQIAKKISDIIESPSPSANVVMGRDAKIVVLLKRFLPSFLWDRLMFYIFK